jgi:hypothetical protein
MHEIDATISTSRRSISDARRRVAHALDALVDGASFSMYVSVVGTYASGW